MKQIRSLPMEGAFQQPNRGRDGANLRFALVLAAWAAASFATAGTPTWFNPLTQSAAVASPDHVNELHSPWQLPPGIRQEKLLSLADVEADIRQSVVRVPGLAAGASMIDMLAFDVRGEVLYIPHETAHGAGVSRYHLRRQRTTVLFAGDQTGVQDQKATWTDRDWGAFDPARLTPAGTLFLGEEWSGLGRIIEVVNPKAAPRNIRIREVATVPNVAHEGIFFSRQDPAVMYFIDEDHSGSIYKIKFRSSTNYHADGDVWVLAVDAFDGDPARDFNDEANRNAARTGAATWVPLKGTVNNPYRDGISGEPNDPDTFGGRPAADEVGGTPYGRPEDVEVGELANGNEVLYFTATSEHAVYSVEMLSETQAEVRLFADEATTPKNQGFTPTTGVLNSPDNLAQDALGNIYVVEDAPNSSDVGGDIWFARDTDGDGVAESLDHFMSLQVAGSESTGMIFHPIRTTRFVVAVQHPSSTGIEGGHGDAVWQFDLRRVAPPRCPRPKAAYGDRDYDYEGARRRKGTCTRARDYNFVKRLRRASPKR